MGCTRGSLHKARVSNKLERERERFASEKREPHLLALSVNAAQVSADISTPCEASLTWGPDPKVLEEEYKTQKAPSKDETVGGAPLGLQGDPLRPPLSSYLEI